MTTFDTEVPRKRAGDHVARLCTELFAPWVWVLGLPFAIAWHATHNLFQSAQWGLVVGVTGSVIPMVVIVRGAKIGKWQSRHVTNREGRVIPFATCVGSLTSGIVVLLAGDAPLDMVALTAAMFVTLVVSSVITFGLRWKVSIHAAVAAGGVIILVTSYGAWLAVMALAAILVSWSRVRLGDHTPGQVAVGSVVGLLSGGLYWWLTALAAG